jgi:hypothetical protein
MLRGEGFTAIIAIAGYEQPDAIDDEDAHGVRGQIDVTSSIDGHFMARVQLALRIEELARFQRELASLYTTLSGEARLDHLEGRVELVVRLDHGRGAISGYVQDELTRLAFDSVATDQTYLFDAVVGLERIVERFPAR